MHSRVVHIKTLSNSSDIFYLSRLLLWFLIYASARFTANYSSLTLSFVSRLVISAGHSLFCIFKLSLSSLAQTTIDYLHPSSWALRKISQISCFLCSPVRWTDEAYNCHLHSLTTLNADDRTDSEAIRRVKNTPKKKVQKSEKKIFLCE